MKVTDYYIAFRRMQNFVTGEFRVQHGKLLVYAKGVGHFGSGDLELTLSSPSDLEKAKSLLERAYNEA